MTLGLSRTTSFSETTSNLKKYFIGKNRICTIQSRLASSEAPSLLSRILGDLGDDLAGGDQDPRSSLCPSRRDNWASTFLEKSQVLEAEVCAQDGDLGLQTF